MIPEKNLGWLAGVLDLKGKTYRKANKMRATPQITLMVESQDFEIIRELSRWTGTNPAYKKEQKMAEWMRRSCVEHCPEAHIHVDGYLYPKKMPAVARWTITGAGVAILIYNLLPLMIKDPGYTELLAEIIENTPVTGQGSGNTIKQIQRLAEIGWKVPKKFQVALYVEAIERTNEPTLIPQ